GPATGGQPQRDHVRLTPGGVLEPAGARAARLGASSDARRRNAAYGAVVQAGRPALENLWKRVDDGPTPDSLPGCGGQNALCLELQWIGLRTGDKQEPTGGLDE